jgi:hypothetical protein
VIRGSDWHAEIFYRENFLLDSLIFPPFCLSILRMVFVSLSQLQHEFLKLIPVFIDFSKGFFKHMYKYFVPDELKEVQSPSPGDILPLYNENGELVL